MHQKDGVNDDDFEPYLSGQTNQVTAYHDVLCSEWQFVAMVGGDLKIPFFPQSSCVSETSAMSRVTPVCLRPPFLCLNISDVLALSSLCRRRLSCTTYDSLQYINWSILLFYAE